MANLGYSRGVKYRTRYFALSRWEREKYQVSRSGVTALLKGKTKQEARGFPLCYKEKGER